MGADKVPSILHFKRVLCFFLLRLSLLTPDAKRTVLCPLRTKRGVQNTAQLEPDSTTVPSCNHFLSAKGKTRCKTCIKTPTDVLVAGWQ